MVGESILSLLVFEPVSFPGDVDHQETLSLPCFGRLSYSRAQEPSVIMPLLARYCSSTKNLD